MPEKVVSGWAGAAGAIGALIFLVGITLVQLLAGESLSATYVSDYANGPYGATFATIALVHSAANLFLSAALWTEARGATLGRAGALLLAAATLGMMIAAIFPTDPPTRALTTSGVVHNSAVAASFPLELAALAVLAGQFRKRAQWRTHATLTGAIAILVAATLVWLLGVLASGRVPGIPERIALFTLAIWEGWTGARLWYLRAQPHDV